MNRIAGLSGVFGVLIFVISFLIFGNLNPDFSFIEDFVSKLGAKGAPLAIWWNIFGFLLVGLFLMVFGFYYGKILKDPLIGVLLALFGLGFAFTAIPVDLAESDSSVSKAHIVAICLGLAFWLFGLARVSGNKALDKSIRFRANVAAILLVLSIAGVVIELWSMPVTHRLVFIVVFGWIIITALELLRSGKKKNMAVD